MPCFEIIEGWDELTIDFEFTPVVWPEIIEVWPQVIEVWPEIKMDW